MGGEFPRQDSSTKGKSPSVSRGSHFSQAKQRKGSEHGGGGVVGWWGWSPAGDRAKVRGAGQRNDLACWAVEKPGVALGSSRDPVEICLSCSRADCKLATPGTWASRSLSDRV